MSYLLFIDESGVDQHDSPYEVLAGVAIRDQHLWNLICQIQEAELDYFGRRVTTDTLELKVKRLLKKKTFKLAGQLPSFAKNERRDLARRCLEKGIAAKGKAGSSGATRDELTALSQAKIAFAENVLELCSRYYVRVFASIVPRSAPRPTGNFLRKDYAYLFERFFYYLEEISPNDLGLVIFDELERSRCHLLVDQMGLYFRRTIKGRLRAARIIPEPFFVHSELTKAIQVADLVAYITSWGFRFGPMTEPRREELDSLAALVGELRYRTTRSLGEQPGHPVWSFTAIEDLRSREERSEGE